MQNTLLQKKYYTIGEVAEITNLPDYVIRFWEKSFPTIKPQKARGRRYYKKEDIEKLNLIKKMLYVERMSIKTAQNILFKSAPQTYKTPDSFKHTNYVDSSYEEFVTTLDLLLERLKASKMRLSQAL
jgi:DNA-binding transcriptional MerR regulator